MKLLHVINSMDPITGGPSQGIRNLDNSMKQQGVHVEVVCLDDPSSDYLGKDKFKIHALGKGLGPWSYNVDLSQWLRLHLPRFDIVVINGLWLYCSYATWRAVKFMKAHQDSANTPPKIFVMPHGMLDPYFQEAKSRRFKSVRNWIYWKLIEHRVVKGADAMLFTCQTELQLAETTFQPYQPQAVYNAGYGIEEPPEFTSAMSAAFYTLCPDIKRQPYLVFLSRIHPKKGTDLLISTYIGLHEKARTSNKVIPQLVIAGPGIDSAFGKQLIALLRKHPEVEKDVFFPGMLAGDAKWGCFYNCEAFILPSHQENFGIVVAEALACSKAVLISNQVNIWQEIEKNQGGIIADDTLQGTEFLLTQWFQMSEQEKVLMCSKARLTFTNNFLIATAAKKYVEIFKSKLQNNT